jgi:hypothetical protein
VLLDGIFNNPGDILALLSDNPYQLWQPVPQKTIFLPVDAGGSTILPIYGNQNLQYRTVTNNTLLRR